ncbi:putative mitochondrial acetoin dehydrogenase e3 component-like protein [Leptomonas pyrrhocoris]|uniref:Putative mitochondrial acetoin dehydrogenase e3 component-like protein n=1 Tax=Leptomonas pyrrhocoris TaxID=157538 RepID=A0A0N0DRH9_LEPPY|nr:putative mitochondrial acetoin dehydrogenase e3 component-like protein [Leptomonas pyrrhocoris]KPA74484.1 putative mitochondrial acetoin dehydrogenase e3 component-like protein [Leptomonas pyrrhocoris]|eukprot:XP_015652923.1 putative mitochondrial acetoin dehydrogenase e3 component-like protein [Leptomonas pyrrhocoris]
MLCRSFSRLTRPRGWTAAPRTKTHFDVCVIGAGPAGIAAALRAADYNKRVCLVEKERVGGADLWNGALQSKTMWEYSNILGKMRGDTGQRLYGESLSRFLEIDEDKMKRSMAQVSQTREGQILTALKAAPNVELIGSKATFSNDHEIQCHSSAAKEYCSVTADYFVIATGSKPREHPYVAADGKLVMTSDHIMRAPLPKSLVIVGGGVIGCEFASIIGRLGKTKVAIIDKASHILPREDPDIVHMIGRGMDAAGVVVHHNSDLYDMQPWEETPAEAEARHPADPRPQCGVQYTVMDRTSKALTTFQVDRALLAVGRAPNYVGLGIENTSLKTLGHQLHVNDFGQCVGTPHIFAIGDAATRMQLVSMGEAQAKLAIDYIYGTELRVAPNLSETMSSVAFLTRAVASVGYNESQCREKGIAYIASRYSYEVVSRAVAAANTEGFVKIIVADDAERRILGVRAVGLNASTLVDIGALAIQNEQTVFDLAGRLTAYPAVSQAFQECLRSILDRPARPHAKPASGVKLTKWAPSDMERGVAYKGKKAAAALDQARTAAEDGRQQRCGPPSSPSPLLSGEAIGKGKSDAASSGSIQPGSFFQSSTAGR